MISTAPKVMSASVASWPPPVTDSAPPGRVCEGCRNGTAVDLQRIVGCAAAQAEDATDRACSRQRQGSAAGFLKSPELANGDDGTRERRISAIRAHRQKRKIVELHGAATGQGTDLHIGFGLARILQNSQRCPGIDGYRRVGGQRPGDCDKGPRRNGRRALVGIYTGECEQTGAVLDEFARPVELAALSRGTIRNHESERVCELVAVRVRLAVRVGNGQLRKHRRDRRRRDGEKEEKAQGDHIC